MCEIGAELTVDDGDQESAPFLLKPYNARGAANEIWNLYVSQRVTFVVNDAFIAVTET